MIDPDHNKTRLVKPKGNTVHADEQAPTQVERGADSKKTGPGRRNDATVLDGRVSPTQMAEGAPTQAFGSAAAGAGAGGAMPEILKNRFILERVLGAGGMGVVYKAKDLLKVEAQDREPYVAIKVLGEEFRSHPEAFIALQRESRKTQRIAHPNIVTVYDFDKDGDTVFMTMEYLEGAPLDRLIKQYRATGLPHRDVWQILNGICAALAYAHQQNIVHADLKPGNIFVTGHNLAKVFDFGIARAVAQADVLEPTDAQKTGFVLAGARKGADHTVFDAATLGAYTPAYASLEMLQGAPPDVRDDIYALGCIAYEMLTGRHPYQRKNAAEVYSEGLRPARISGISSNQWRAIESALAVKRGARLPSVPAFQALISQPVSRSYRGWLLAALLAAGAGGAGWFQWQQRELPPPVPPVSENDVRVEIEQRIRVELVQNTINALLAEPSFDERWQDLLWNEMQNLHALVGETGEPVPELNRQILQLYVQQAEAMLEEQAFERVAQLLQRAEVYQAEPDELQALNDRLQAAIAQQTAEEAEARAARQQQEARRQEARQRQQNEQAYAAALDNVNEQLSCKTPVAMEDLAIAVKRLQAVNAQAYSVAENSIVQRLAGCIRTLATAQPERARVLQQEALALFGNHRELQGITIAEKDPCSPKLAGLGARNKGARCQDSWAGGGRGPQLVVIPKSPQLASFAIGRYEVSVEDFNEYCSAAANCRPLAGDPTLPATGLSVQQIQAYLQWLSERSGHTYRLPSREEWQYAARANSQNLPSNRICQLNTRGLQIGGALVAVNLGQQNPWGLINSVGNAREWVQAGASHRAMGGSFATPMDECSVATEHQPNAQGDGETGFRVARELAGVQ